MSTFETPNEGSPTRGIELTIEAAREDIITSIHILATIYLFVEDVKVWCWIALAWTILQFIFAIGKELKLRMWRLEQRRNLDGNEDE